MSLSERFPAWKKSPLTQHLRKATLLLSTSTSTMLLYLNPEIVEADVHIEINSQPTLATSLVPGGSGLIQVTPRNVVIWSDIVAGSVAARWEVGEDQEIVAAQVHHELVVIANRGGKLVILLANEKGLDTVV